MKNMRRFKSCFIFVILHLLLSPALLNAKTVAFVGVKNLSQNPDYDYLAAFTEGLILFDLSAAEDVVLVERSRLDKILAEQQLQLAGLTGEGNEKKSIEIGKLLAADYIASVDYTLVSGEVAFTLRVTDTTEGSVRVFTSRGTMENDIHVLSEGLARHLTGKKASFVNNEEKRSLLTLRDLKPGSVSLYCNLINAEILLNDKFAGYTKGDMYNAVIIPDIDPGTYTMKIRLSNDFGMVKLPEFTFSDWEESITVKPGRITTTRALIRHFNDTIYSLSKIFNEDYKLTDKDPNISVAKPVSFTDREGKEISMKISVKGSRNPGKTAAACTLNYGGKDITLEVSEHNKEKKEEIGKVRVSIELYTGNPKQDRITVSVTRTDIYQGMHKE